MGGQRRLPSGGTASGPRRQKRAGEDGGAKTVGGAKKRPEPNTLRAAGATGSRVYPARLGISETVSATKSLGLAARVGKMGRGSADSPKPEWSGGGMKFPREHPWASASLGGLRGATRKATKSCATGQIQRSREGLPFRAGLGRREAQISDSCQWHFLTRDKEFSSLDEWRTRLLQIHTKNSYQHWQVGCPVASSRSLKCWSRCHKARL